MRHEICVSREKSGLGLPGAYIMIKRAVRATLDAENISVPCLISVLLTDDGGIRKINRDFRGMDKPTDVLSFPQNELAPGHFDADIAEIDPETGKIILGDMAISLERAVAQGEEYGHGTDREVMYLAVHSVLHLLGYDHVDEGEMKKQMREREKHIMCALEEKE